PRIIQPWTAFLYVFGGLALPLLPFYYNWDWPRLRLVLACYALASALAFVCYWAWPLSIVRPSFEQPGLGDWLMRQGLAGGGRGGQLLPQLARLLRGPGGNPGLSRRRRPAGQCPHRAAGRGRLRRDGDHGPALLHRRRRRRGGRCGQLRDRPPLPGSEGGPR